MIPPHDPRPDLPDTAAWTRLLTTAHALYASDSHGVFGILHGMRCYGAALKTGKFPRLERGEMSEAEYSAFRAEYLVPNNIGITWLLGTLKEH